MECTRAEVQWDALTPPSPTLSLLGATFKVSMVMVMVMMASMVMVMMMTSLSLKVSQTSTFQHGLDHNLSLNHYSGPGPNDLLFLQVRMFLFQNIFKTFFFLVWTGSGGKRVNANAVMSGQRFEIKKNNLGKSFKYFLLESD